MVVDLVEAIERLILGHHRLSGCAPSVRPHAGTRWEQANRLLVPMIGPFGPARGLVGRGVAGCRRRGRRIRG